MTFEPNLATDAQLQAAIANLEKSFPGTWNEIVRLQSSSPISQHDLDTAMESIMSRLFRSFRALDFIALEKDEEQRDSLMIIMAGQIIGLAAKEP